jgi:hypothetical protein
MRISSAAFSADSLVLVKSVPPQRHLRFDAVTCLFASIAYCRSTAELRLALECMARHVNPGGLVIVEPFITPEKFKPGHVSAIFVDRLELKIARIHTATVSDIIAVMLSTISLVPRRRPTLHEATLFSHDQIPRGIQRSGPSRSLRHRKD